VANEIYTTTRDGLADLVSRQVADRVLAQAVGAVGSTPDIVDASTMSRLLRGRVRRELERTLPRSGVRRQLAELDARLARERAAAKRPRRAAAAPESGDADPAPAPTAGRRQTVRWRREPADVATDGERRRAFPIAGDPELAEPRPPSPRPDAPRPATVPAPPAPRGPAVAPPAGAQGAASGAAAVAAAPVAAPPGGAVARPDRWIERIAERDAVRQWVWSPAGGAPEGRGVGPEPERVAAALAPLVTVLGRHGTLRSLHVHHGRGHVLVGIDRGSTLTVAGDDALNLGAIYATFRALEEEP
jgi:hypothetical protein